MPQGTVIRAIEEHVLPNNNALEIVLHWFVYLTAVSIAALAAFKVA